MEIKQSDPKWHVVYTRPKSERKVASRISAMGIESFLPMHKVVRQWSDRKKKLVVPLFPNYVFVKVDAANRGYLFSIKEFVTFISIERKPVVLREKEIMAIKQIVDENVEVLEEDYFQQGMKVRIKHGQFEGLEGIILKKYGNTRLLVKIDTIMKAYSFNVSTRLTEAVATNTRLLSQAV
jgi:transcription antitermination factor NusG